MSEWIMKLPDSLSSRNRRLGLALGLLALLYIVAVILFIIIY
jgi:hypothetical protein